MADWKNYIWVIPIVGGVLSLISMALPAIVSSELTADGYPSPYGLDIWMIGFFELGPESGWGMEELYDLTGGMGFRLNSTPFIISFIGVLIGAIAAIGSGVLGFRKDFKKFIALLGGILMVAFSIIFIIWVEVEWKLYSGDTYDYLGTTIHYKFSPGFGVIAPIIGGVIAIASFFMPEAPPRERKAPVVPTEPKETAQPQAVPPSQVRYCPNCGAEVPGEFCPSCGTVFKR